MMRRRRSTKTTALQCSFIVITEANIQIHVSNAFNLRFCQEPII